MYNYVLKQKEQAVMQKAKYKRVIIKLSGQALAGEKGNGIDQ